MVGRAVDGDEDALVALLEDAGRTLIDDIGRQVATKYRSLVDAEDVFQVTCMEAFLRIRSFAPATPEAFAAWLRRVAMNNLRDAIKELERDKRPTPGRRITPSGDEPYDSIIASLAATTTTPSRVCGRAEIRQSVESALRQLPPDYERVLRLYELEGLSGDEVAEFIGRSHGAVRMLLARARERLAELLIASGHWAESA